ncbi:MAG: hypothetical protein K2Y29_01850 [Beijerinckiaceae bacterium]|nr:hypothetical protein [Beijerinckiaceae bacterium]
MNTLHSKTPDGLYEAAVERMAQSIAMRRAEPDYCAIADGDFVIDHDIALAMAAAQAVGLRELYDALFEARSALARAPAPEQRQHAA